MESSIPELRGEREKEAGLILTVDGPSGAGKGVLADQISEMMDLEVLSAGSIFRDLADERGMTVMELSRNADRDVDLEVDGRILENSLERSCVVESRLASRVLGGYADFTILLTADLEERAGRVAEREEVPLEKARERVKERDESDRERYREHYGIDPASQEDYDCVIDNTDLDVEEERQLVKQVLRGNFPERF